MPLATRPWLRPVLAASLAIGALVGVTRDVGHVQGDPASTALYLPLALDVDTPAVASPTTVPSPRATAVPRPFVTSSPRDDVLDQLGGAVTVAAADERRMYVGVGARVLVFDADDGGPAMPLGQSEILPGIVESLLLADRQLYAVARGGLYRLDVGSSDSPGAVALIGDGVYGDVVGDGRSLFVAAWVGGPAGPTDLRSVLVAESLDDPLGSPTTAVLDLGANIFALDAYGTHVYAATESSSPETTGVQVIDVGVTAAPRQVATIPLLDPPGDLGRHGDVLYVTNDRGITVIDTASPATPRVLHRVPEHSAYEIAVGDDYLAVYALRGLQVYTLDDPAEPRLGGRIEGGPATPVFAGRRWLYATTSEMLLRVDITVPQTPVRSEWFRPAAAHTFQVALADDGKAVVVDYQGAVVVDTISPETYRTGRAWEAFDVLAAAIDEPFLYTVGPSGLAVRILGGVAAPEPVAVLEEVELNVGTVVFRDDRLYVCDIERLTVVDVAEPTQPEVRSVVEGDFRGCAVDGALVASGEYLEGRYAVKLLDVTVAEQPAALPSVPLADAYTLGPLALEDGLLAVIIGERLPESGAPAADRVALRLIDVSSPSAARPTGGVTLFEQARDEFFWFRSSLALSGQVAYLSQPVARMGTAPGRMLYVDLSDPAAPRLAAIQPTLGQAFAATAGRRRTYVADGAAGLVVLEWPEAVPNP